MCGKTCFCVVYASFVVDVMLYLVSLPLLFHAICLFFLFCSFVLFYCAVNKQCKNKTHLSFSFPFIFLCCFGVFIFLFGFLFFVCCFVLLLWITPIRPNTTKEPKITRKFNFFFYFFFFFFNYTQIKNIKTKIKDWHTIKPIKVTTMTQMTDNAYIHTCIYCSIFVAVLVKMSKYYDFILFYLIYYYCFKVCLFACLLVCICLYFKCNNNNNKKEKKFKLLK